MTQQIDRATVPNTMQSSIADGFHPDGHAGSSSELSAAHAAPELCNGSKDSPAPLPDASVSARLRLRQMTHRYRRFIADGKKQRHRRRVQTPLPQYAPRNTASTSVGMSHCFWFSARTAATASPRASNSSAFLRNGFRFIIIFAEM